MVGGIEASFFLDEQSEGKESGAGNWLWPVLGVPLAGSRGRRGYRSIGEDITGGPLLKSQSFLYETDLLGL